MEIDKMKKKILAEDIIEYLYYNHRELSNFKMQKVTYFSLKEYAKNNPEEVDLYFEAWRSGPTNMHAYNRYFTLVEEEPEEEYVIMRIKKIENKGELVKIIDKFAKEVQEMEKDELIEKSQDFSWKMARKGINNDKHSRVKIDREYILKN